MAPLPPASMANAFRLGDPNRPGVAWFEFLLDPARLEEHLKGSNGREPVPSGSTLLSDFLQHAENRDDSMKGDADGNPDNGRIKTSKTLRLLSLKTAALMKWNFNLIESVPLPQQMHLFHEMMAAAQLPTLTIENGTLDLASVLDSLKPYQRCSVALYHRWCLFTLVNNVTKNAPQKVGLIPPTVTMPTSLMVESNPESIDAVLNELDKMAPISCQILSKIASSSAPVALPTSQCFANILRPFDDPFDWEKASPIPVAEARCQDNYDLGVYLFYKEDMDGARQCLERTVDLYVGLDPSLCSYCVLNESRLRGFALALHIEYDDMKTRRTGKAPTRSLESRFHACVRKKDAQGLAAVLEADVISRELSVETRTQLELDVRIYGHEWRLDLTAFRDMISVSNAIRSLLADGECLHWNFTEFIRTKHRENRLQALYGVCVRVLAEGSERDKRLLKRFLAKLAIQGIPVVDALVAAVGPKSSPALFSDVELNSIRSAVTRENARKGLTGLPPIACKKFFGKGAFKLDPMAIVRALCASYDPHLVRGLSELKNIDGAVALEVKKRYLALAFLEKDIESMGRDFWPNYFRTVIAKIRRMIGFHDFDRAELFLKKVFQDYDSMASQRRTYNARLRHHLEFEELNISVERLLYQMQTSLNVGIYAAPDVITKARACIGLVMNKTEVPNCPMPPDYLIENCAVFLLNSQHWDDWTAGRPGLLGVAPEDGPAARRREIKNCLDLVCLIGRLTGEASQDKPGKEAFKSAKLVWENAIDMFLIPKDGPVPAAVMTQTTFREFFSKLVHPTLLSVLISMLSVMVNALKQDPTCEIEHEYAKLWPNNRVNNASAYSAVEAADLLDSCLGKALSLYPRMAKWVRARADVQYGMGHHSLAMKYYLECIALHSRLFTDEVRPGVLNDVLLKRMITCCMQGRKFTYAGILCQYLEDVDKYNRAFQCLQNHGTCDASDELYHLIWDVTILEYVINMHSRRGEELKMLQAIRVVKHLDVNSNNADDIKGESVKMKKNQFFRLLAEKYWTL